MIELFYDATPNGRKVLMMLEETGVPYRLQWVDLADGQQHAPEFVALSPSSKIPALIDPSGGAERIVLFESGAILVYLAERAGQFLPSRGLERHEVLKWLFWQTSTFGPAVGQATHFHSYLPRTGRQDLYSQDRYVGIAAHLYGVLDRHLAGSEYIADRFSIADLATYPWVRVCKGHGIDIDQFPNVRRWSDQVSKRPSAKVKPEKRPGEPPFHVYASDRQHVWNSLFRAPSVRTAKQKGTKP